MAAKYAVPSSDDETPPTAQMDPERPEQFGTKDLNDFIVRGHLS
jgi:hypothetical protein